MYYNINSILYNNIFTDYIISTEIDVDLTKLEIETYRIQDGNESLDKTNSGGYHSPLFEDTVYTEYGKLRRGVIEFTNYHLLNDLDVKYTVDKCEWWTNVSGFKDSMELHTHGATDFIGIFYVKVPEDSGYLRLLRCGAGSVTKLGRQNAVFRCDCVPGRLYLIPGHVWHHVTTNFSQESRISAAFNIYLK